MPEMRRDANAGPSPNDERLQLSKDEPNRGQRSCHGSIEVELARWFVSLTMSNLDRYRCSSAELHLHFGIGGDRHRNLDLDFCAVSKELIWPQARRRAHNSLITGSDDDLRPFQAGANCDEFTMLISVLQTADNRQDTAVSEMRQLIRLRTYDECLRLRWKAPDGSQETFPSFLITDDISFLGVPGPQVLRGDREPGILPFAAGTRSGYDHVIECASQVVYEVAQHDGDHWIRLLNDVQPVSLDVVIALWLPDGHSPIRVAIGVSPGFTADIYHVLLRPLDLEPPGVSHVVHSSHEQEETSQAANLKGARNPGAQARRRSLRTKKVVKAKPSPPRATSPFHLSPRTLILALPSSLADGPAP